MLDQLPARTRVLTSYEKQLVQGQSGGRALINSYNGGEIKKKFLLAFFILEIAMLGNGGEMNIL